MTGGLQTALALSIVALASIYLGWKVRGLVRAFFTAARGRGGGAGGSCGGCGANRKSAPRVEMVRFPSPGEKSDR